MFNNVLISCFKLAKTKPKPNCHGRKHPWLSFSMFKNITLQLFYIQTPLLKFSQGFSKNYELAFFQQSCWWSSDQKYFRKLQWAVQRSKWKWIYRKTHIQIFGAVELWLSLLHEVIQLNAESDFAQVQILLATCWCFAIARTSNNATSRK